MSDYYCKLLTKEDIDTFTVFYNDLSSNHEYKWSLDLVMRALTEDLEEVYTAAEFKDGKILSILTGYSINIIWDKFILQKKYNFLPHWIMGLWVSNATTTSGLPHDRGDQLTTLLSDSFLALNMESFYVARKANSRVNYTNAIDYILRYNRTEQYEPTIEKIYYSEGYDRTKLNLLHRILCHYTCEPDRCVIVVKYVLKNKYRS